MRIPPEANVDVYLMLDDDVHQWAQRVPRADWQAMERRLDRIAHVSESCLNHQSWIKVQPTACTYEGIDKQIRHALARARTILQTATT